MTDLINACRCGNINKVKKLLEKETIDPNLHDKYGDTALLWACCSGRNEIVKLLLNYEKVIVNPNLQDSYGNTALIYAVRNGHNGTVKLLLNYEKRIVDLNHQNKMGYTAPILATRENHKEIAKLLELYTLYRRNIKRITPSYNILIFILMKNEYCTFTIPNEIILMIKEYGKIVCGRELF